MLIAHTARRLSVHTDFSSLEKADYDSPLLLLTNAALAYLERPVFAGRIRLETAAAENADFIDYHPPASRNRVKNETVPEASMHLSLVVFQNQLSHPMQHLYCLSTRYLVALAFLARYSDSFSICHSVAALKSRFSALIRTS